MLLTDDGTQINFPKKLLPNGVPGGDILSFEIERDEACFGPGPCGAGPVEEHRRSLFVG